MASVRSDSLCVFVLSLVSVFPAANSYAVVSSTVDFPPVVFGGFEHAIGTDLGVRFVSDFATSGPPLGQQPPGQVEQLPFEAGFLAGDTVTVRFQAPADRLFRVTPHPDFGFANVGVGASWEQQGVTGIMELVDVVDVALIGGNGVLPASSSARVSLSNAGVVQPVRPSIFSTLSTLEFQEVAEFEAIELSFVPAFDGAGPFSTGTTFFSANTEVPIDEFLADATLVKVVPSVPEPFGIATLAVGVLVFGGRGRNRSIHVPPPSHR